MARSLARNPLTDWIRENLANADYGTCKSLTLVYERQRNGGDEEVQTVKFAGQQYTPEELADRIYNIAKSHCKDDGGVEHRYRLGAFYDGDDTPKIQKRFRIVPYGDDGDLVLADAPDAKGALAQGMRLTEQFNQGMFGLFKHVWTGMAGENEKLRSQNMEMFEMVQNLLVKVQDADHNRAMEALRFERETQMMQQWLGFAPLLINTILDREVFPQGTVDTKIVESVADALSADDLQMLAGKLPAHLWGPLAARLEKYLKAKREKGEERGRILRAVGADDVDEELGEPKEKK